MAVLQRLVSGTDKSMLTLCIECLESIDTSTNLISIYSVSFGGGTRTLKQLLRPCYYLFVVHLPIKRTPRRKPLPLIAEKIPTCGSSGNCRAALQATLLSWSPAGQHFDTCGAPQKSSLCPCVNCTSFEGAEAFAVL